MQCWEIDVPVFIALDFSFEFSLSFDFGCEASSCSFAESLFVLAASAGPKTVFRRFALLRFETLARTLFAILKRRNWWNPVVIMILRKEDRSVNRSECWYLFFFFFFLRLDHHWRAEGVMSSGSRRPPPRPPRSSPLYRSVAFPVTQSGSCSPTLLLSLKANRIPPAISRSLGRGGIEMSFHGTANYSVLVLNYASWRRPENLRIAFIFLAWIIMASTGQSAELQSAVALVKTLTNAQLKDILRNEGLAVSGVKASLQIRIIDCL